MTTLARQPLFPELESMERRVRRMFEGTLPVPSFMQPVVPAADVYETAKEFVVELEVPGYDEKELTLEVSDHTLTVTGAREESKEETEKRFRLHERLEQRFERTFVLPPETDGEHVTAQFEKGVLKVHAPKLTLTAPRKIAIAKS